MKKTILKIMIICILLFSCNKKNNQNIDYYREANKMFTDFLVTGTKPRNVSKAIKLIDKAIELEPTNWMNSYSKINFLKFGSLKDVPDYEEIVKVYKNWFEVAEETTYCQKFGYACALYLNGTHKEANNFFNKFADELLCMYNQQEKTDDVFVVLTGIYSLFLTDRLNFSLINEYCYLCPTEKDNLVNNVEEHLIDITKQELMEINVGW